jgi:hypothetical protein
MKTLVVLSLLLFPIIVLGCNGENQSDQEIDQLYPGIEMNTSLSLFLFPPNIEVLEIGDSIDLVVKNTSNNLIVFPPDFGIEVFVYSQENDRWAKVNNRSIYYPRENRNLNPIDQGESGMILFSVDPDITISSESAIVRIIMIGTFYKNGLPTDKRIGAYIDLPLNARDSCDGGICVFLAISEPIKFNQSVVITATVTTEENLAGVKVFIGASDQFVIWKDLTPDKVVEMDNIAGGKWVINPRAGIPVEITAIIQFVTEGQTFVFAEVYYPGEGGVLTRDWKTIEITHQGGTIIAPYPIISTEPP